MMLLCVGCSATLSDSTGPCTPANSEKPDPPTLHFGCPGGHACCGRCQRQNRRLAQGCILCETVNELMSGGDARALATNGGLPGYSEGQGSRGASLNGANNFVVGDDDDEELPPAADVEAPNEAPPGYEGDTAPSMVEKGREQVSLHYLRPDDTLNGLALKYGVDGRLLCQMNKLPNSTLSTTPALIHTLPFLLLPPNAHSSSTEPIHPPEVERRRLIVRRFQVRCRCADWAMASAYVDAVFSEREKEAEMIRSNRLARGDPTAAGIVPREGGELDEAVASFERDERWEKDQKGAMGSRLKSTGQVEGKVKGWSWPR